MQAAPTRICAQCGYSNPGDAAACQKCSSVFPGSEDQTVLIEQETMALGPGENWSMVSAEAAPGQRASLGPGAVIAERYEIVRLLGEGGMGAVYQVRDRELDRFLALKVIRPELAGNPKILRRFKQELIVARQVTHKNVIRIFDLGSDGGVKFITMEFVEGRDLSDRMEERRFTLPEACQIMRQVARALEAAFSENVVHRDLKPQNIMLNDEGRVWVMDFGLARSVEMHGLTQTGAVMGTPAYMSPEQAKGEHLDTRSDTFAFGIIFYELTTGVVPFQADTMLASLLKRTQEDPQPPSELNPEIPPAIENLILRCLAKEPADRYQSPYEILAELDAYLGDTPGGTMVSVPAAGARKGAKASLPRRLLGSPARKWGAAAALALALAGGLYWFAGRRATPAASIPPMTVLIADLANRTADPVFNGTLEPALKVALEGAPFINAVDRTRVRDLGLQAASLDQSKAREIAANQGLQIVVSGSIERRGSDFRLSASAVQTGTGKVIAAAEETAPGKDQVLFAAAKVGASLRKGLGDRTAQADQDAAAVGISSSSLEAVHEYAAGLDARSAGKYEEARQHLARALELDSNFGMAYAAMAATAADAGRRQDAGKYIREALKYTIRMTERERFRTRASLYVQIGHYQKCADEFGAMLEKYPADSGARLNLAGCYLHLRNLPKALEESRRALTLVPKGAGYQAGVAMSLAFSGDARGAAASAAEATRLGYAGGPLLQAFASLLQDDPARAAEYYRTLEKINPSEAAAGLADLAAYEGRYSEAAGILEKSIAADDAPARLRAVANLHRLRGQKGPALAAANRALELTQEPQTRFVAAQVFAAFGDAAKAREIAAAMASDAAAESQTYARLIEGEIALKEGNPQDAVKSFAAANSMLDTWIGRFDLGRAYLETGAFPQADSEFDRCIKRRGEALALFLDLPTYSFYPPVYYYQGRAREGMKSAGFAESYRKYLAVRGKSTEDPLLPEVRRRAGN